ncbi:MAG: phosphoglycerate kinase [Patescibacteria group bacterium]
MKIKSIKSIKSFKNKTVMVRADFDVPLKNNRIVDDARLKTLIPTVKYLLVKKAKQIILIGHLDRPKGKVDKKLSLKPIVKYLSKTFKDIDLIGSLDKKSESQIVVLENIRFWSEEEKNNKKFAKKLSKLADIYVNECFSTSHRKHASVDAIQSFLPSYAGLHLEKEISNLSLKPKKPLVLVVGGAKIETKLPVINSFLDKAEYILVGGAVANNFLKARGEDVGKSLIDKKYLKEAVKILKKFKNKVILPVDYVSGKDKILDIGPRTIMLFNGIIKSAKTIIWNGPMGNFEKKKFANGTFKVVEGILSNTKANIVIGGGETGEVLKGQKIKKNVFVSVGGGAMLEFLAGKKLPGLKKIIKK